MDALNSIGGGYTRLRELAEADREGRVTVEVPAGGGKWRVHGIASAVGHRTPDAIYAVRV